MLPPLASISDALDYGYEVTGPALNRASSRVRGFLRQQITSGTSTVVGMGPSITLPQRPVVSVTSAKDSTGAAVEYTLSGRTVDTYCTDELTVVYAHGFTTLPDPLIELVCSIAARITATPAEVGQGISQESMGPHNITYGSSAWRAQSGLSEGEMATLRALWPSARTINLGAPAQQTRYTSGLPDAD